MEYAESMTATPPIVTDDQFAGLLDQLGESAMVELTTQVALANLYARSNVAMGIESQGFSSACAFELARPDVTQPDVTRPRGGRAVMTDSFVQHRSLLFTVAYELLGSAADAEDVVQETWLRWAEVDPVDGA